ncbi:MAG TPA: choice-of-anchor tandem repeat GloVer-containing protein [Terriglobales bacterium]|nr:choice-of-anchor tandem repeat GloVer-containing protein [Terriglobales bacterium]
MKSMILNYLAAIAAALLFIPLGIPAHAQTYTPLYTFGSHSCDPINPEVSGIIAQGRDGNLYSSTAGGGCDVNGAAFKITPKGKLTVLHSFQLNVAGDGIGPLSGLTLGTDGDLWGTTEGEDFNAGNIFRMTAAGKVTNFDSTFGGTNDVDGFAPVAPPVQGMDGNFYGMTSFGGNRGLCTYGDAGCGVIYRITSSGKVFKVIYTFNQTNGANPDDALVLGTDGNFYGTTSLGGTVGTTFENAGVVFKVTPSGKYTQLYAFCAKTNCTDGANPYGGLIQATDGDFYGTTQAGGQGIEFPEGVVFKITASGEYTLLHTFCTVANCPDGAQPYGGLVQGADGNFYGTTNYGGANNLGTIFQITPTGKYTVLHSFENTTGSLFGAYPEVTLIQNTNGILYGDTYEGGTANAGVFFSLNMGLKPFVSLVAWYGKVGQTIEILGQGLTGTTAVSFNGTAATFTVVSDTYLTAVLPSGTTAGLVTVTTPGGALTSNRKFIVQPFIGSFDPTSGPVGTPVTIAGTSFTGATKVTFGGVKATKFSVNSDIKITATVPTGAKTGPIAVTTPDGTATSSADFTVTQ